MATNHKSLDHILIKIFIILLTTEVQNCKILNYSNLIGYSFIVNYSDFLSKMYSTVQVYIANWWRVLYCKSDERQNEAPVPCEASIYLSIYLRSLVLQKWRWPFVDANGPMDDSNGLGAARRSECVAGWLEKARVVCDKGKYS